MAHKLWQDEQIPNNFRIFRIFQEYMSFIISHLILDEIKWFPTLWNFLDLDEWTKVKNYQVPNSH